VLQVWQGDLVHQVAEGECEPVELDQSVFIFDEGILEALVVSDQVVAWTGLGNELLLQLKDSGFA
jgi:hypothetical protein